MKSEQSKIKNAEDFGFANDNLLWIGMGLYAFFIIIPYFIFFIFNEQFLFIVVSFASQVLAICSLLLCVKKVFSNNKISEDRYKKYLNCFDFHSLVFALRWNKISPYSREIIWSFLKEKFPDRDIEIPNIYK